MKHEYKNNNTVQSGNIFTILIGAVALVGVVSIASMSILSGPVATSSRVMQKTMADSQMFGANKMIIMDAVNGSSAGDCDNDGYVEPSEFRIPTTEPAPTGGGLIPTDIGTTVTDPWGTEYGYCVWNVQDATANAACDDNTDTIYSRLKGDSDLSNGPTAAHYVMAIISAGPDRIFQSSCSAWVTDATTLLTTAGDDIVQPYTYSDAAAATSSIWEIETGTAESVTIDKGVKLADESTATTCGANDITAMRYNGVTDTIEVCDGAGGWNALGKEVFELNTVPTPNVIRNIGNHATEDFVFGSPQLDDDTDVTHDARFFFDKSKSAFRAGRVEGTEWNDTNIGTDSFAAGTNTTANGLASFATGDGTTASGNQSVSLGKSGTASGTRSIAIGDQNVASAQGAIAIGKGHDVSGQESLALGENIDITSSNALGLGFDGGSHTITANNVISMMADEVMIGTTTADGIKSGLKIVGDGVDKDLRLYSHSSISDYKADVELYRSLGSEAAQTAVVDGTLLGTVRWNAFAPNGNYEIAAKIGAVVNGTPSSGTVPTDIIFNTISANERMRIFSGGNIFMGIDDYTDIPNNNRLSLRGDLNLFEQGNKGDINFYRTNGTLSAKTSVAIGNTLATIRAYGWDGDEWAGDVAIGIDISPTAADVGNDDVPTEIYFQTVPDGSKSPVERMRIDMAGNIGIGTATPSVELDIVGNIEYTGTITDVSDRRLKTDIEPLKYGMLDKLAQINAYSFRMKGDMKEDKGGQTEFGFMAQELEEIFPELVRTAQDEIGTKSVNYIGLIAPTLEGIKELKVQNDVLRADVQSLKSAMKYRGHGNTYPYFEKCSLLIIGILSALVLFLIAPLLKNRRHS